MELPFLFSEENNTKIKEIINKYPKGKQKSALIPILHLAQEQNGYLSVKVMDVVANILQIKPVEVYEVATFYSMFHLNPVGEYVFEICQTGPCMLRGADKIIEYVKNKLNIEKNQTTSNNKITLKTVECLGACGYAPMMQLGKNYIENLTPEKIDDIINDCMK